MLTVCTAGFAHTLCECILWNWSQLQCHELSPVTNLRLPGGSHFIRVAQTRTAVFHVV